MHVLLQWRYLFTIELVCSALIDSTITTSDGEQVPLKDALTHFFNSQVWREMKESLAELWRSLRVRTGCC